MPLVAKDTSVGSFERVPEGLHRAICNMVVDLGLQEREWQGQKRQVHQVYIRWEFPMERIKYDKDGEEQEGPMVLGEVYTLSLSEKANLRKHLEAWRGRKFTQDELNGFDLFTLLGKGCQIQVSHNQRGDKTFQNIQAVVSWPKDIPQPATTECPLLKYGPGDEGDFDKLPDWLKAKINNQVKSAAVAPVADEFDDEIPF